MKSSSTGVSRPNIEISARTLPFSKLISSTCAIKSMKGPSVTRTVSPNSKPTRTRGSTTRIWRKIDRTSSRGSGLGSSLPTKPVTPGVLRTTYQVALSSNISTST